MNNLTAVRARHTQGLGLATVVSIDKIRKHPDPETNQIGIVDLFDGRQVCVRLDTYQLGDLAVYFPLGAVLPETKQFEFVWETDRRPGQSVPVGLRRVSIRNMRGQESQGLLQPVKDFQTLHEKPLAGIEVCVGDDVSYELGVTGESHFHYISDADYEMMYGEPKPKGTR